MTEYHIYDKAGYILVNNCIEAIRVLEKYNIMNSPDLVYAFDCGYAEHFPHPLNSLVHIRNGITWYKIEKHWYVEYTKICNNDYVVLHTDSLFPHNYFGTGDKWVHVIFGCNPIGSVDKEKFGCIFKGGEAE